MRQILIAVLLFVGINSVTLGGALAQNIPYHNDPSARVEAPDPSLLPAIRFLTSNDFAPFNFQDEVGQLKGFHIDMVEAICDEIDISCTVQVWPFEQIADALISNQGDAAIAGLEINEESAKQFDFSDIYLMFPARFVRPINAQALDAKDQLISVRRNSSHAKFIAHYLPSAKVKEFENEIEALKAMKNGQVSTYFGDGLRASFWLAKNLNCCTFVGEPYFNSQYFGQGLAIAFPAGRSAPRDGVNYALARLKKNGMFDEIYLRWFPISFY